MPSPGTRRARRWRGRRPRRPGRGGRPARARSRAAPSPRRGPPAMSSSSSSSDSIRTPDRRPDWAAPRMSPSRRVSRSSRASSNPSEVARDGGQPLTRSATTIGASVTSRQRPGVLAARHPAAELVQLADAEPVGVHDHHDRGVGDVDADLDDGRGHQDVDLAGGEGPHPGVLLLRGQPAVQDVQPQPGQGAAAERLGDVEDGQRRAAVAAAARPSGAPSTSSGSSSAPASSPIRGQTT